MADLFAPDGTEEGAPSGVSGSDFEAGDPFADAQAGGRAKIGRPKGSRNKHSEAFESYYYRKGFRDPLVAAAQLVTADPVALASWFAEHEDNPKARPSLYDVVKLQLEAGRDLAPYLHGKAPVKIHIEGERLPYLVINAGTNQLAQAAEIIEGRAMTIGQPEPSKNKDLEGEE